ncbi:MAG: serine/threonine-protein kinase [Nostoc sp. ChiSLP02]|nr:serine/threonine-protein kinase [Nostoc sp. DedSLP05]MDZ8101007.1 serine/threonine-protein kinase [Nostoc sp. DedSLP01]MDZ8188461.1 serine/threonine-protein kinase [Nostoc sp. ChiSLP02]
MLPEYSETQNNGNSSESTPRVSEAEIQQLRVNKAANQRLNWFHGKVLKNGRYEIERPLNQGGFAIVYLAKDTQTKQQVALKVLKIELQEEYELESLEENFVKEAIYLSKCEHQYIVQFKDIFKDSDTWCIVIEYIEGEDLNSWVKNNGSLSEKEAIHYIRQIGEALKELHAHNLLHRDVKPKNIIRRANGSEVVLIDLGISRKFSQNQTDKHTPLLTQNFAPIEQHLEKYKRGAFTDVYALAATLYYLITGIEPKSSLSRKEGEELDTPSEILGKKNLSISPQVNNAIILGMQIYPKERPQTIQEWLNLLPDSESELKSDEDTELSILTDKNHPLLNPFYSPIEPTSNDAVGLINALNCQLYSWIATFTSPIIFLVTFAILSWLGTTLISAGFWMLLAVVAIISFFLFTKERTQRQKIGLIISSFIPTLIIFIFVPGLKDWKIQGWEFIKILMLILLNCLLGFAVMSFFEDER